MEPPGPDDGVDPADQPDPPTLEDELFGMESVPAPDEPVSAPPPAPARSGTRAPPRSAWPTWRTGDGPGCRDLAVTTAGFGTFILVDCVMMYAPFRMKESPSLLPQLLTLLLLAFGLGGMLVWHIRGGWRPFGIGLMLGWLFMTLVSAGFLTGLNP